MKLKFADPESILFVKKDIAKRWLINNLDVVFDEFESHGLTGIWPEHPNIVINDATDVYFWFTLEYSNSEHCFFEGTIVKWQKKKWYVYFGHEKPITKECKGQLLFEGCQQ